MDPLGTSPGAAYCSGKLANVLFAKALAARFGAQGLSAFSFHPGTVASNFFSHVPAATKAHTDALDKITPEQGAETLLWLASQPVQALENGGYYYRCAPRDPNPTALDPANAERLWDLSDRLVASVTNDADAGRP
jgi:NAD(P)-dependent dehydrogenase (short-subunit alcohol dehydrogenase family)